MPSIKCGAMIRNRLRPNYGGTLGCVVVSRTDPTRRYILTAGHVIARGGYALDGEVIEAMTPSGWVKIGEFERAVTLRDAPGVRQVCDAAIARITNNDVIDEIDGIGTEPAGSNTRCFQGTRLKFAGAARSGQVIEAELRDTDRDVQIFYQNVSDDRVFPLNFQRQLIYGVRAGELWNAATKGTDSGALILDTDNIAVGLHLGLTPDDFEVKASICTPIQTVFDALDVRLPNEAPPLAPTLPPIPTSTTPLLQHLPQSPAAPQAALQPAPGAAPVLSRDDRIGDASFQLLGLSIRSQMEPHNEFGGVPWLLTAQGLVVDGKLERSPGALLTVPRVWLAFGPAVAKAACLHKVPVELIVATICTESSGDPNAIRFEPGYVSDQATPDKVSPGLMQTLISTARSATGNAALSRNDLMTPAVSIDVGTCYIAQQRTRTRLDPPKVACAYNAGGLYLNDSSANRWRMRQFPIGTGAHADRFTMFFNDCFAYFAKDPNLIPDGAPSYFLLMGKR